MLRADKADSLVDSLSLSQKTKRESGVGVGGGGAGHIRRFHPTTVEAEQ